MKKFSTKTSVFLLLIITVVVWTGLGFGVYHFLVLDTKKLRAEIIKNDFEYKQLEFNAHNLHFFEEDFQKAEEDSFLIARMILAEEDAIIFIEALEEIASRYNLSQEINLREEEIPTRKEEEEDLEEVDEDRGKDEEDQEEITDGAPREEESLQKIAFKRLIFNLDLTGSFPDFVKYVQAVESMDYYPNISSVNISIAEGNLVKVRLDLELAVQ